MRTSCCLNLPPPTSNQASNASLIPITPPHVSLVKNVGCWRRQCVLMGVASYCTIIGLEMDNSVAHHHVAVAQEMMTMPLGIASENNSSSVSVSGAKWSEKRACPPWRGNSLETIVPENLPRPAARRRYQTVRSSNKDAPPLSVEALKHRSSQGSCFSM